MGLIKCASCSSVSICPCISCSELIDTYPILSEVWLESPTRSGSRLNIIGVISCVAIVVIGVGISAVENMKRLGKSVCGIEKGGSFDVV